MIRYSCQDICEEDIQAVVDTLRSEWLTQGPTIERFERAVAEYCGAQYAVATCNGTAALHIACLALGVGKGDLVWTSPNTFVASANCARYCGANVDFVDINPNSLNIDAELLEVKLKIASQKRRLPKVIIPVHFAGDPCEMERIRLLAERHGIAVLEDAAHAIGAEYSRGGRVGNCANSEMTVFSLHAVKGVTTGEGGIISTNRKDLADRLKLLRSHGITRQRERMQRDTEGDWYYEQCELGFNYRLTEFQAALGLSQMKRLGAFIARRRELAEQYNRMLSDLSLRLPRPSRNSAWHLYVVRFGSEAQRVSVFKTLRSAGIGVQVHYIPVHLHPYYRTAGFRTGDFPFAEEHYRHAISIPIHYRLRDDEQRSIVEQLKLALTD